VRTLRAARERLPFKRGTRLRFPSPLRGPPFRAPEMRTGSGLFPGPTALVEVEAGAARVRRDTALRAYRS
jgi:hypothetical protein